MSGQLSLSYEPSYEGSEVWSRWVETIRSAVNHLGLKEVTFALDVSGSMLSDSLNERDRKRWAGEWIAKVFCMLCARRDQISMDLARQVANGLLDGSPFEVVARKVKTPEQERDELAEELRAMGKAGEAALKRVRGAR